jgi:hypothetical protein
MTKTFPLAYKPLPKKLAAKVCGVVSLQVGENMVHAVRNVKRLRCPVDAQVEHETRFLVGK